MAEINLPDSIGLLQRYLELTSARQSVITTNIANVDTPNYKTKDIDFRSALHQAMGNPEAPSAPAIRTVSNLVERPDGNNVSMEREGLLLSETQLQTRVGVQLVRSEFHRWQTAINEGK
jgi:flagellar basal-body rod protein FlgB